MPFQILALSGGGYLGLYTAEILARLEAKAGKPLARCFDLVSGTSIGGILAIGLAFEIPAPDMRDMFVRKGDSSSPQGRGRGSSGGMPAGHSSGQNIPALN